MPSFNRPTLILTSVTTTVNPKVEVILTDSQCFVVGPANPTSADPLPTGANSRPFSIVPNSCRNPGPPPGRRAAVLQMAKNLTAGGQGGFDRRAPIPPR